MAKIASVAMRVTQNVEDNINSYIKYIELAAEEGVELILFPELSLQGFPPSMAGYDKKASLHQYEVSEVIPEGNTTRVMSRMAKKYNMYISWGMTEQDSNCFDKLYNACVLVGPEGYIGHYRKVHLPGTERLYSYPGNEYPVFDTKIGKIGIMICFDKMFPEVARILKIKGADVILCPTAWPVLSKSEDDPSLRIYKIANEMRAIENNVYIIDSNNVSDETPDGFECGHSRIVNPDGITLSTTGFDEGLAIAEVDLKKGITTTISASMATYCSYLKDRQVDTYGEILVDRI